MPTSSCEIEVRDVSGTAVLVVSGDIDRDAESKVSAAYEQAVATDPRRVILDFASTEYINSSGIALIVSVLARARADGRSVAAVGLSDHYREIFEITRLSDFIELYPDVEAAVAPAGPARR
jgi:anti-sigma B factor antagonist